MSAALPRAPEVWWAAPGDAHAGHLRLLAPAERARLDGFAQPADAARSLAAAALLRLAAGAWAGADPASLAIDRRCPRCGQPHGRPRLPEHPGLEVSVAHAGERVVVALADAVRVGVDVEQVRDALDVDRLALSVLSAAEAAGLAAHAGRARRVAFLEHWTAKEAVLKARGTGIAGPLADVDPRAGGITLHPLDPGPGYVACLALLGPAPAPASRDGAALLARGAPLRGG